MLSTTRVNFPVVVENRLRTAGDFIDNIMEFARDDLVGFRRPIAATFALATPLFRSAPVARRRFPLTVPSSRPSPS